MQKIKIESCTRYILNSGIFGSGTFLVEDMRVWNYLKSSKFTWLLDTMEEKVVKNINITQCKFREFADY